MLSKTVQMIIPRFWVQSVQANLNIFAQNRWTISSKYLTCSTFIPNSLMTTKRFPNYYLRTFTYQNDSYKEQLKTSENWVTDKSITQPKEVGHPGGKSQNDNLFEEAQFDIRDTKEGKRLSKMIDERFWTKKGKSWPEENFDKILESKEKDAYDIIKAFKLINAKMVYYKGVADALDIIGFEIGGEFAVVEILDHWDTLSTSVYCTDPNIFDKLKRVLE